ncbi:hypothetical protein BDY19DRAFT_884238 [Irpex rosettiformis]|uniref:Uncharacterized protein n=1 Tax=Irpex rosettiformis TaxID=378272 RepID=A0ACB8UDD5_9APHY|nr:hypothetical protein BDY19DRAFT_884238 [Irpex rosettiformis]
MDLTQFAIPGLPQAYYIPNFVTEDEEKYLIRKITESPLPRWRHLQNRRLQILGGEVTSKNVLLPQAFPSYITEYPDIIGRLRPTGAFAASPHKQPNHIILNEYRAGQGIMAHEDGPSYYPVVATLSLGSHAVFHYYRYTSISVGADEGLTSGKGGKGRSINTTPVMSVLLEPRSLVITTQELYATHLHGIDDVHVDTFPATGRDPETLSSTGIANIELISDEVMKDVVRGGGSLGRETRYSLTCRDIERVAGHGLGLGRR